MKKPGALPTALLAGAAVWLGPYGYDQSTAPAYENHGQNLACRQKIGEQATAATFQQEPCVSYIVDLPTHTDTRVIHTYNLNGSNTSATGRYRTETIKTTIIDIPTPSQFSLMMDQKSVKWEKDNYAFNAGYWAPGVATTIGALVFFGLQRRRRQAENDGQPSPTEITEPPRRGRGVKPSAQDA